MADGPTIALLAALHTEMAPTLRRLRLKRARRGSPGPSRRIAAGTYRAADIEAYVSGMGERRTGKCVDQMLAERRPDAVIQLGFAGALNPALRTGDVIEPGEASGLSLHTVDHPVLDPAEKTRLYAAERPDAVDMETGHAAARLEAAGVAHLVIRVITDTANESLPPEAVRWINPYGRARPMCLLGDVMSQPILIHKMWRLRAAAKRAGATLAERVQRRLDEMIERL